ncbi:MAG: class I SAM-dependent methyltransferase [Myxococcales bacterium]|nr:class I SAM-dependent methyltransferase [Myxococcales bacterium]
MTDASPLAKKESKSLAITALYTAEVWRRGGLPGADLLATPDAQRVYGATEAALGIARVFSALGRLLGGVRYSPLPVALLHRHTYLDHLVRASTADAVIELAAGLSPRGLAETAQSARAYLEVDMPEMIAWKRELLSRTDAGKAALARAHLRFEGADLRTADLSAFTQGTRSPLIVAEGLLMYLSAEAQRSLFRRVADAIPTGGELLFDLVPPAEEPPPGLLGRGLGWLMRRFTGGADFVRERRTRVDVLADLSAAGFEASAIEPHAQAAALGLPHPSTWTRMVVFRARRPG